jgi:hypothetical protein
MNIKKLYQLIGLTLGLSMWMILPVMAQQGLPQQQMQVNDNFTDEEYEEFVNVNVALLPLQEESQEKMIRAIEGAGLEVERFQELAQSQQAGKLKEVASDENEIAKFNEAGQQVIEAQQEMNTKVVEAITSSELSEERFQEMYMAYNQSQKVKSKVDDMIAKRIDK